MKAAHAPKRTPAAVRLFFVLAAAPFFFVFPYLHLVNNPNENVRTYMTIALVEEHTFCIDHVVSRFGWVNDMAAVPPPSGQGAKHYYSVKAPAVSFAGVPVYWAFAKLAPHLKIPVATDLSPPAERVAWLTATTWALRIVCVQLPCFVFLIWFERYLRAMTPDVVLRLTAVAAAGLGTNYLGYALMYVSHALFAVAAFASFAITERELRLSPDPRRRRKSMAFLAGFYAGLATLLEYHALPVSLILAIYAAFVFYRPARLSALAAGGTINALAMMFFQWAAFGNPLMPGHKMVENPKFAEEHHRGLFGVLAPSWEAFSNLSLNPGYGFFGMSPYMALGLLAIPFTLVLTYGTPRERRLRRVATTVWMLCMASLWTIMSGAIEWRAGWTLGTRYLGAAPPFFALGAVTALERIAQAGARVRAAVRGVAAGTALASVASIGFVGLLYNTLPPEGLARPLTQFAIPLARAGFVPHHVGEWIGLTGTTLWYVVAAAMFAATLVAGLVWSRDTVASYAIRAVMLVASCALAMVPALSKPREADGPQMPSMIWMMTVWEPQGRDRIAVLRGEAERSGTADPCLWHRLANLERAVSLTDEAARDAARSKAPPEACPQALRF